MKTIIYIFFFFLILSCKSKQANQETKKQTNAVEFICPSNGVCGSELISNSTLKLSTDNLGALYATIEKGENIVFKFLYKRNKLKNTSDSNYSEYIYAEFNKNLLDVSLENQQLKEVKLLFNRVCFCKGQTGFYPITKGKLSFKKTSKNSYTILLDFTINEVPQVITTINETLFLK